VPIGGADVSYFNLVVNGGLVPGEIAIMMGPMGGFKTTIAIDLVCSMAKLEDGYSAFFAYEQAWRGGDLPIRFMSRLSGVDRDVLINTPKVSDFTPEHAKMIEEGRKYSKYVLMMDRSAKADKVGDIAAMVREMKAVGKLPKLIVIDQLMTWMQNWPEAQTAKDDWFRKRSTGVIKELKSQICEEYGTSILMLHQITAGKISGQKGKKFDKTDAQENKAVGNWADFVITIGTPDENLMLLLHGAKTRRGPGTECVIQALPKTCRFKMATDYTVTPTGGFEKKGSRNVVVATDLVDTAKMKASDTAL
jgi:hypothetical protein